jgi:Zn-dependent M16 (insulinase) family peptidase
MSEAFSVSAQVGFAAGACDASVLGTPEYAHETILAHLLSTGPLWEEIRVRRGAYGAFASADGLEGVFTFSSYRDPKPVDSLAFFGEALALIAGGARSEEVEEAAVGSAGRDLRPMLPEEKGLTDFKRELYGISDELRQTKRDALLAVKPADLARAAARLAEAYGKGSAVLISHAADVQLLRSAREGTRVTDLPL